MAQEKNRSSEEFSQRTSRLAEALAIPLSKLPEKLGMSERMFYGYRSGAYPITQKASIKLAMVEREAALGRAPKAYYEEGPLDDSQFFDLRDDITSQDESQSSGGRESQLRSKPMNAEFLQLTLIASVEHLGRTVDPVLRCALAGQIADCAQRIQREELRAIAAGIPQQTDPTP